MLDGHDSTLAMHAICEAAYQSRDRIVEAASAYDKPSFLYRPKLFIDGDHWCALYGDDLQNGIAGFGKSPYEAICKFDDAWYAKLEAK
jgi:hypothetical protein